MLLQLQILKVKGSDDGRFVGTNVLNEFSLSDSQLRLSKSIPPLPLKLRFY